jgi:putative endonuclease
MSYWVYILRSETNGKTCVGQTDNLEHRVQQHNGPSLRLALYTKRNPGPWTRIHSEEYAARADAMHREKWLKSGQGREWVPALLAREERAAVNPPTADTQEENPPRWIRVLLAEPMFTGCFAISARHPFSLVSPSHLQADPVESLRGLLIFGQYLRPCREPSDPPALHR